LESLSETQNLNDELETEVENDIDEEEYSLTYTYAARVDTMKLSIALTNSLSFHSDVDAKQIDDEIQDEEDEGDESTLLIEQMEEEKVWGRKE